MSDTKRHKSQLSQSIEWGTKRPFNKHYSGTPNRFHKSRTASTERLNGKSEIKRNLKGVV